MSPPSSALRVLFVIDSLGGGGAERSTAVVLPYLRDAGVDAQVVTLYRSQHGADEATVRARGFEVHTLRSTRWTARVRELHALIRQLRPDVVHTALFNSDILGRLASVGTHARVVSSLVSTPYDTERRNDPGIDARKLAVVQAFDAITARLFVDRFQAVSLGAARANARALRYPMSHITVVERGRDPAELGAPTPERRQRVRDLLGIDDAVPLVLAVGRSDHQKAHHDLVKAMAVVKRSMPEARLAIAGRAGNAHDRLLQALGENPDVQQDTLLLGHRNDVPDLLATCDCLAIASRVEGTAGVALEAMALRAPVVATRTTGVEGILVHETNALLAPVGDDHAIAAALLRVLSDGSIAMSLREAGQREFTARFTVEASASRLLDFYRAVTRS